MSPAEHLGADKDAGYGPALAASWDQLIGWEERARTVRLCEYLSSTELADRERVNALGNGFDTYAVASRIGFTPV